MCFVRASFCPSRCDKLLIQWDFYIIDSEFYISLCESLGYIVDLTRFLCDEECILFDVDVIHYDTHDSEEFSGFYASL